MYQELTPSQTVDWAIQARHDAWVFYHHAAELTRDAGGQRVFTGLADHERELALRFFRLRSDPEGEFDDYFAALPTGESALLRQLRQRLSASLGERQALELALAELAAMLRCQRQTAERIVDPVSRAYFARMIAETEALYHGIEAEYAHQMGMVDSDAVDSFVRE